MLTALVPLAALAAAFFGFLFFHGLAIDRAPYSQRRLWRAIHVASLGGAALGTLANCALVFDSTAQCLLMIPLVLFVWRITSTSRR